MESIKPVSSAVSSAQADVLQRQQAPGRPRADVHNMAQATDASRNDTPNRVGELHRLAAHTFARDKLKLSIRYHEGSGRFIYRGLNPETGEVVREYPPEEILERMAELHAELRGLSVDRTS